MKHNIGKYTNKRFMAENQDEAVALQRRVDHYNRSGNIDGLLWIMR